MEHKQHLNSTLLTNRITLSHIRSKHVVKKQNKNNTQPDGPCACNCCLSLQMQKSSDEGGIYDELDQLVDLMTKDKVAMSTKISQLEVRQL